ncbi:MAG TPA: hypothetical protein VNA89_12615 [Gemmatimonadaceae bacterium]|nr:hypothetical protein [Gemmatimonadaceae bacterium]
MRRRGALLLLLATPSLGATLRAQQAELRVDALAGRATYEGFLPSGLAVIAPTLAVRWPAALVDAAGSVTRYQSGNVAVQGALSGSLFGGPWGAWRGELAGSVGGATHQTVGSTGSLLVHGRLHRLAEPGGVWVGAGLGQTLDRASPRPVLQLSLGAWLRRGPTALSLVARPTRLDRDLVYTDIEALVRVALPRLELDLGGGVRTGAIVGERDAWGEAGAVAWLTPRVGLLGSVAGFPTDPARGLVGGHAATFGLRIATRARRVPLVREDERIARLVAAIRTPAEAPELETAAAGRGRRLLRVRAPAAARVEVMGDFTAWEPAALRLVAPGVFEGIFAMAPGPRRLNLRVDGGEWRVPRGATPVADEFGGEAGLLVVP